ncbi:MAG: TIGR04283 family arsenosugar biosynthesis glycosyltransferase [Candidatus Krumholzibacteria bacterium]|nr:TIGR04283 family arsenosugar biosynthesis glycosyltransferase [Candidatus Krumholzibacteria bacterium]
MQASTLQQTISVIIPVYREAHRINNVIGHVRRLDRMGRCQVIVVDGDPSGATRDAVEDRNVITLTSSRGRARQMNAGASLAKSAILLFLHADTYLPDNGIELISATMKDRRYVGGAFGFRFDSTRMSLALFAYLASMSARITRLPLGDHAIFVRKEYFAQVGGYPDIPIMEDVELMRRIKKRGDRISVLKERVTTSARRIEREGMVYCAIRSALLLSSYSLGISPARLKKYYPDGAVSRDWLGRLRQSGDG